MPTNVLLDPISYVPGLAFLALLLTFAAARTSTRLYAATAAVFIAWHVTAFGWVSAAVTCAVTLLVFGFLIMTGLFTRTTTFALPVLLLSLPLIGWVAVIPGFVALTVVSVIGVRRAEGSTYLTMLAGETVTAMGAQHLLAGSLAVDKPKLASLPTPTGAEMARVAKVSVVAYLGLGICLTAIISAAVTVAS